MRTSRQALLAQAKVARQKKIAIAGSFVLAGLLALQGPRTLKLLHESSAPAPPPPTASATPATTGRAPTTPLPIVPSATLPDTDRTAVKPELGQLVSFGLFKAKDPFLPQISTSSSGASSAPAPAPAPSPTSTARSSSPPVSTPPQATSTTQTTSDQALPIPSTSPISPPVQPSKNPPPSPAPATTTPLPTQAPQPPTVTTPTATTSPPAPAPPPVGTSVAISTNEKCEVVPLKGTFPAAEKLFRVTTIAKDGSSAQIAIVGGSYEDGSSTVTLAAGLPLTFLNTADGVTYDLKLLSSCGATAST